MFIFRKLREFLYARQVDILSAAVIISVSILISRVLGLVRDRVLAGYFHGAEISLYFAADRFPNTLFEILVLGALSAAFIPTFISYISEKKDKEAWKVTGIVLNLALVLFAALGVLIFVFAKPLYSAVAAGFSAAEIDQVVQLTRLFLLAQGFFVLSFFLTGALKAYQRFLIPAAAPILYNLGTIAGTVLFARNIGVMAPVLGSVVGAFLHFAVQLPLSWQLGFRPTLSLDFRHPGVKRIARLAAPRILELGFLQLLKASELFFASLISTASYAYFTFAQHLEMIPVSLFGLALADAALPALSYQNGKRKKFEETFFSVFRQIIFLTLPMAAAFAVLRIPLVRLAFGAARFTWESTVITGYTLSMFALGIVGQALTLYFVRAFYALHNTAIPVATGVAAALMNIALAAYFVLVLELPIWGVALAFAISALVQAAVLGVFLMRKAELPFGKFVIPALKVGTATFGAGSVMYVLLKVLDRSAWDKKVSFLGKLALPEPWPAFVLDTRYTANLIILTAVVGTVGALVYLGLCRLLRVEEIKMIPQIWRKLPRLGRARVVAGGIEDGH